MVRCNHCAKNVPGVRPYDGGLACDLCGRILENFNFSTDVTFIKNAAGQSQASGNIVTSVESGNSSSRIIEKGQGEKDGASDESGNLFNIYDSEVDDDIPDEKQMEPMMVVLNLRKRDYKEKQAFLKGLNPCFTAKAARAEEEERTSTSYCHGSSSLERTPSQKESRTETVTEKKKKEETEEHEIVEDEED